MTATTEPSDLDVLSDPRAMESRGIELADLLRVHAPSVIMTWEAPANLVLAHIVARELGAVSVRCYDRDGLAAFAGDFGERGRIAFVGLSFSRGDSIRAMIALAEQQHQEVVAAGAFTAVEDAAAEELERSGVPLIVVSERSDHADG